jgi:hypothetical protein
MFELGENLMTKLGKELCATSDNGPNGWKGYKKKKKSVRVCRSLFSSKIIWIAQGCISLKDRE